MYVGYSRVLHLTWKHAFYLHRSGIVIACLLAAIMYHIYFYNVWEYLHTVPFMYFQYPLEIDVQSVVDNTLNNHPPAIQPLNNKRAFPYVLNADKKCKDEDGNDEAVFLIMLIKSRLENLEQRRMIRRTWSREFGITSVTVRRVFLLGVHATDKKLQHRIGLEQQDFGDIVQQFFEDSYFNNSLKLLMGFQWAVEYCVNARFVAVFDDNYFVNTKNVVSLLKTIKPTEFSNIIIGYVWNNAMPFRIKDSEWYISMKEYPYRFFPPYVTSGSFFLPMMTAERVYIAMQYTKILRFDDVFVGIVAWKLQTRLLHNPNIYFYHLPYDVFKFRKVIAAHGFDDLEFLYKVWKEQTELDINNAERV